MKIKITTAFRPLNVARASRARNAKNYMVKSVNKDGSVSRMVPTAIDWQSNTFVTTDATEVRRAGPPQ